MDSIDNYTQSYMNLEASCRDLIEEEVFNNWFKDDLLHLKELLEELNNLPKEVDFKSINDIDKLRAYIREELRRNEQAKKAVEACIDILRNNLHCPPTANCVCSNHSDDTQDCRLCWNIYIRSKIEGDLPF